MPNYLLQYFENADAYQIGIQPKGCIDLTLATKILVYDKQSNPYSMGIKCPSRVWKLQCDTESERDEWVSALRNLLQDPQHTGYIADYNPDSKQPAASSSSSSASAPSSSSGNNGYAQQKEREQQLSALQARMKSMENRKDIDRQQIKAEAEMEYKQQLDIQRENIVKWKEKIEELNADISEVVCLSIISLYSPFSLLSVWRCIEYIDCMPSD